MSPSDLCLLERAAAGDQDALAELLQRHGPLVRTGIAHEIPARWQSVLAADDVMQQTYVDAFRDIVRFDPAAGGTFAAWLATLARRNLLDALRMLQADKRGGNRQRVEARNPDDSLIALCDALSPSSSTPSGHVAWEEASQALRLAVEGLPPIQRQVVSMYDLEGRPVQEVAAAVQRSPGAVFMVRARAHRRLRDMLGSPGLYFSGSTVSIAPKHRVKE